MCSKKRILINYIYSIDRFINLNIIWKIILKKAVNEFYGIVKKVKRFFNPIIL